MSKLYSYKVERAVDVVIVEAGVKRAAMLGITELPDVEGAYRVFGMVAIGDLGYLSHMSYGLDCFDVNQVLHHAMHTTDGWFYFFGTVDQPYNIKIAYRELEVAFFRLGMIDRLGFEGEDS